MAGVARGCQEVSGVTRGARRGKEGSESFRRCQEVPGGASGCHEGPSLRGEGVPLGVRGYHEG